MRQKIRNILFDLDGTLTDPKEGITKSIQYALIKLNVIPPSVDELEWTIGPPLIDAFKKLLNTENPELLQRAIFYYRERYEKKYTIENKPYEGIHQTLTELKKHYVLYLATSKPWAYAGEILEYFNMHSYFTAIHGSELDGTRDYKAELIKYILTQHQLNHLQTLMIGDRHYDIDGAKQNKVSSIGVTYGYGSLEEITDAQPDVICHSHQEIAQILINPSKKK